jgi:uncharacterized protein YjbJ (UPF0337 family)
VGRTAGHGRIALIAAPRASAALSARRTAPLPAHPAQFRTIVVSFRESGNVSAMRIDDTAKNRSQQVKGKTKEVVGKATKNKKLEWSGKSDMASGEVKQRGSKISDAMD